MLGGVFAFEEVTVQNKSRIILDRLGIFCSGACALHCLMVPIIVLASPTLASYFENEWVHVGMILLIIPIAGISFYSGKKLHGCIRPMKFGFLGIGFLVLVICFERVLGLEVRGLEIILTMVGGTFLIIAHFSNIKYLNCCQQRAKQ